LPHAGIRVMMITGDYPVTARAIAAQAQIACDGAAELLTGDELAGLDDAQLQARIQAVTVCARIAPTNCVWCRHSNSRARSWP
jgi:Ca2+-transporting ATPase